MKQMFLAAGLAMSLTLAGCGGGPSEERPRAAAPTPTSPAVDVSAEPTPAPPLPVWWDEAGLHHGDDVEKPAVRFGSTFPYPRLALVRSGALYRGLDSDEIWFHPWEGTPRVVGHGSPAGPAGDAESDTAAWFRGTTLVVYDTARGEVVSRSRELVAVSTRPEFGEHLGDATGWVHVSPTQVVWRAAADETSRVGRRDLISGISQLPWEPRPSSGLTRGQFVDVSEVSAVWGLPSGTVVYDRAGASGTRRLRGLEWPGRLSHDGRWLLSAESADGTHGAGITDLGTGRTWKAFRREVGVSLGWSYGDVAMLKEVTWVDTKPRVRLFGCSATARSCDRLPTQGYAVVPIS